MTAPVPVPPRTPPRTPPNASDHSTFDASSIPRGSPKSLPVALPNWSSAAHRIGLELRHLLSCVLDGGRELRLGLRRLGDRLGAPAWPPAVSEESPGSGGAAAAAGRRTRRGDRPGPAALGMKIGTKTMRATTRRGRRENLSRDPLPAGPDAGTGRGEPVARVIFVERPEVAAWARSRRARHHRHLSTGRRGRG